MTAHTSAETPIAPPHYALFPHALSVSGTDRLGIIRDFMPWLATVWQLDVRTPQLDEIAIPGPLILSEPAYTCQQLSTLFGLGQRQVRGRLYAHRIPACSKDMFAGSGGTKREWYLVSDLAPLLPAWHEERMQTALSQLWRRFCGPACQTCHHCRTLARHPASQQLFCNANNPILLLRRTFTHWIVALHEYGSVAAWWEAQGATYYEPRYQQNHYRGILLVYLLDRQLIHLEEDDLVRLLAFRHMPISDLLRPWRHRQPEEYAHFEQALELTGYGEHSRQLALVVFATFGLLKYGLESIAVLRRPLNDAEIRQVIAEERLLTKHLGGGIYLPVPLNPDVRAGHVLLDDMRRFFWRYGAARRTRKGTPVGEDDWQQGPGEWRPMLVSILEQALCAPHAGQPGMLSRRPETEGNLPSPLRIRHDCEEHGVGLHLLPPVVQESIRRFIRYRYEEKQREYSTLHAQGREVLAFFCWAQQRDDLVTYPDWSVAQAHAIFRAYHQDGLAHVMAATRRQRLIELSVFFQTLQELEEPCPLGYRILPTLERRSSYNKREVPREAIMDRVFREGVRRLSYDPYSRLALTIQYFCGTRTTETLDLRLFCVVEDEQGHPAILIPKGKTKQERPFPIVEVGMGPLLAYMDEILRLRVHNDRTSRLLGKTNYRYLTDAPEEAQDWHYLFDRVTTSEHRTRGRLSRARVIQAMHEACLITAKIDPTGLFDDKTYDIQCHFRRRQHRRCDYVAGAEGVTTCPRCGATLPGTIGFHCRKHLSQDVVCDGVGEPGAWFCPKCDAPLAKYRPITAHSFRHNSVGRAHRAGVSLANNMLMHGHQTITMHLRYLTLFLEDTTNDVRHIFVEQRLREVRQALQESPGQLVVDGQAVSPTLDEYLGLTLHRGLMRRTYGVWGGFWAGSLAQHGIASPHPLHEEIVILEDTYEHAVAQYWYEVLGLAVSEVAYERFTQGTWRATVPTFLRREKIEELVQLHLRVVQDVLATSLGPRLMETDIHEQRQALHELADRLRPWWRDLGAVELLVMAFMAGRDDAFQQQLPPAEQVS